MGEQFQAVPGLSEPYSGLLEAHLLLQSSEQGGQEHVTTRKKDPRSPGVAWLQEGRCRAEMMALRLVFVAPSLAPLPSGSIVIQTCS